MVELYEILEEKEIKNKVFSYSPAPQNKYSGPLLKGYRSLLTGLSLRSLYYARLTVVLIIIPSNTQMQNQAIIKLFKYLDTQIFNHSHIYIFRGLNILGRGDCVL